MPSCVIPIPQSSSLSRRPSSSCTGRSHSFAGQLAGLLHPIGELSFVELVVLMDVEVAHFLLFGFAGGRERSDEPRKKATLMYFVKQWMPRNQPWPSIP